MKGWALFKCLFALGFMALLAMLYWSSSLLESDLKAVRSEMKQLRYEVAQVGQKVRSAATAPQQEKPIVFTQESQYPNLLEEDPYFTQTLPALLGEDFEPKGILKQAMITRPDNLHPFNGFRDVSNLQQLCTGQVGDLKFGQYETLAPDMAERLEARPREDLPHVKEYWVFLKKDLYWQPLDQTHFPSSLQLHSRFFQKHLVSAHDFKFYFDAVMNPYVSESKAPSIRSYLQDIEEFVVVDDYTFIVRWKPHLTPENEQKLKYTSLSLTTSLKPLPSFVFQYFADGQKIVEDENDPDIYRKSSVWAQNFSHHWAKNVIVSCGPYLFAGMDDEGIYLKRNPEHHEPYKVLLEGLHMYFKESFDSVWQDFKTGKIDLCLLSPNQLIEYNSFLSSEEYAKQKAEGKGVQSVDYVDLSFYYLGWNTVKPYFSTPRLRQAMTMAIDRNRIIEQNLNNMAIGLTGPLSPYSPSYDQNVPPLPYDPDGAREILDEEGWVDMDGDGIRDKIIEGKKTPFRFKLYYFVKSLSSKVIADYIATSLHDIGVDCQLSGMDIADLSRQFDDKSFDAIFMGWKLGSPPEDHRQLWHSEGAKEKGSSNLIGFAHPEIDRIIDSLNYEYDKDRRISLYHHFHRMIQQQAPYTFLYTPKIRLLYRDYVKNVFIPLDNQDVIPGANVPEPNTEVVWIDKRP